jgi:predicted nucleic acid-binding protein
LEIARFRASLRRHRRVALDTCVFIYQWEANPRYAPLTDRIFSSLDRGDLLAVTSMITMTELLVHPYREHDRVRANELFGLLSTYPNLEWVTPHLEIAARAAEIRAQYGLQTPDAIQAATAIHSQASAFLTNDAVFERVSGLGAIILDQFV